MGDDSFSEAPGQMSHWERHRGKWVAAGIVGVIVILGALGVASSYYLRDAPPPDDSDLLVRDAVVPEADNGLAQLRKISTAELDFYAFAEAHGVDDNTAEKISSGLARNDKVVDDFLIQAQPALVQLDFALARPYFVFNDEIKGAFLLPETQIVVKLRRALGLAALHYQQLGDYTKAVSAVLRLRQLALRMAEPRGALITFMLTTMANQEAAQRAAGLLNDPALPLAEQSLLAQAYAADAPWNVSLGRTFTIEYQFFINAVKEMKVGGIKGNVLGSNSNPMVEKWLRFSLQENASRREMASFYRLIIQALAGPYSRVDMKSVPGSFQNVSLTDPREYFQSNFGGRVLMNQLTPALEHFIESAYVQMADDRLLRTGFALRRYYNDHQALPSKLDDLVPQYLSVVPADPFDGQSLCYNAARGVVYSVGTSLVDAGGSSRATAKPDENLLGDREQPTLLLKFQKPVVSAPPADAAQKK